MHASARVFITCVCFYFLNFGETRIPHIKNLPGKSCKTVKCSLIKKIYFCPLKNHSTKLNNMNPKRQGNLQRSQRIQNQLGEPE